MPEINKSPFDELTKQINSAQMIPKNLQKINTQVLKQQIELVRSISEHQREMVESLQQPIKKMNKIYADQLHEAIKPLTNLQFSIETRINYQKNLLSQDVLKEFKNNFNYQEHEILNAHNILVQENLNSFRPIVPSESIKTTRPIRENTDKNQWDNIPEIFKQRINTPFIDFVNIVSAASIEGTVLHFIHKTLNNEKVSVDSHFTILLISLILFIASYNNENQNH